jgi:hypothetical protein
MENNHQPRPHFKLAVSATTHCLVGCGFGEITGVVLGIALGLNLTLSTVVGIMAGFVFGYGLGLLPLLRSKLSFISATKIVLATETFSIIAMETGEVLTERFFPGMMNAKLNNLIFWIGLVATSAVGFATAFPVNLYLVRRGVRHHH